MLANFDAHVMNISTQGIDIFVEGSGNEVALQYARLTEKFNKVSKYYFGQSLGLVYMQKFINLAIYYPALKQVRFVLLGWIQAEHSSLQLQNTAENNKC